MNLATLALEDGTVFEGMSFGALKDAVGEVVFNTALTGYQEIFTDPSYSGQIVVLTNPQIGNYGSNLYDEESSRPRIEGLIVREFSSVASNWRSGEQAESYLSRYGVPIAGEIDTRALVRHLRTRGVMRGALAAGVVDRTELIARARNAPSMAGLDLATRVSTPDIYHWDQGVAPVSVSDLTRGADSHPFHVVAYDYGIKRNILRRLVQVGTRVTVVPSLTSAEDVLALKPDGIFLSNGPGDPEPLHRQVAEVRKLIGRKPIFGICLGHQILGLALGGKTYKLKFGHRGANHPVLNQRTNIHDAPPLDQHGRYAATLDQALHLGAAVAGQIGSKTQRHIVLFRGIFIVAVILPDMLHAPYTLTFYNSPDMVLSGWS